MTLFNYGCWAQSALDDSKLVMPQFDTAPDAAMWKDIREPVLLGFKEKHQACGQEMGISATAKLQFEGQHNIIWVNMKNILELGGTSKDGNERIRDADDDDLAALLGEGVTLHHCTLEPGQLLYVPPAWTCFVRNVIVDDGAIIPAGAADYTGLHVLISKMARDGSNMGLRPDSAMCDLESVGA